jgi:hypothetical protein
LGVVYGGCVSSVCFGLRMFGAVTSGELPKLRGLSLRQLRQLRQFKTGSWNREVCQDEVSAVQKAQKCGNEYSSTLNCDFRSDRPSWIGPSAGRITSWIALLYLNSSWIIFVFPLNDNG